MAHARPPVRELAERSFGGTRVRLLWRQGTTSLWVELRSHDSDRSLAILVPPERALDAFHHPYAYAGHGGRVLRADLAAGERGPEAIGGQYA